VWIDICKISKFGVVCLYAAVNALVPFSTPQLTAG